MKPKFNKLTVLSASLKLERKRKFMRRTKLIVQEISNEAVTITMRVVETSAVIQCTPGKRAESINIQSTEKGSIVYRH